MTVFNSPETAQALIFDWDGTLVDTRRVNYETLSSALSGYGIVLTEEWYYARTGVSTAEMIELLLLETGTEAALPIPSIVQHRDELFLQRADSVQEIPGVACIARRYRGRLPLAVASGGSASVIAPTMRLTRLETLFDVVITREDVEFGKPAPDLFLEAARRLAVSPSGCLVYEDSDEGILAARRAGMDVVDIRTFIETC